MALGTLNTTTQFDFQHYKNIKAKRGIRGHFCMWRSDESSNSRDVNAFCGMNKFRRTRKILQFEFLGLHTFL